MTATKTVKLSEMSVGDRGIATVNYEDMAVELRDGGKSGGCEHDLVLVYIGCPSEYADADMPRVIIDTDNVSI